MAQIQRESAALDELLGEQVVEDVGVRALPAAQVGADTHGTGSGELGVLSNTESLLVDLGGYRSALIDVRSIDAVLFLERNNASQLILTADSDVVVAVLDIGMAAAVPESGVLVEAGERSRLAESAESLAERLVGRLGAVGVHPELGGAGIKVDGDSLRRRTNLEVNGVEEARLAVVEASLGLAAHVSIESVLVAGKGESHNARTLIELVVEVESVSGQRQSRDRNKSRTHVDCWLNQLMPA